MWSKIREKSRYKIWSQHDNKDCKSKEVVLNNVCIQNCTKIYKKHYTTKPEPFKCALQHRTLNKEARWPPRRGWGRSITSWNRHCLKRKWTVSLFAKGVERGRNVRYIFCKREKKIDLCQNRDQEISTSEDWQDSRGSCTWSIPDFRRTWQSKYGNLQWIYSKTLEKQRYEGLETS